MSAACGAPLRSLPPVKQHFEDGMLNAIGLKAVTEDDQRRKLELVVKTAEAI